MRPQNEADPTYRLLHRFGERVVRYWAFNVGERKDDPCGLAVERALLDYEAWRR